MNKPSSFPLAPTALSPDAGSGVSPQTARYGTDAQSPSDGWGKLPRCETCERGFYGCICNAEDGTEDHMPAADVVRIMGDYFPNSGWGLAERSAYGMGAK